jgi:hypothetical protein
MTELSTPRGPGQMDGGVGRTAGAAVGGIGGQGRREMAELAGR